jgi:hypothetical protein
MDPDDSADLRDNPRLAAGLDSLRRVLKALVDNPPQDALPRFRELIVEDKELLPLSQNLLPLIDDAVAKGESGDLRAGVLAISKIMNEVRRIRMHDPRVALAKLEPLAKALANSKSADFQDVLRGLRELISAGKGVPPLVAEALAARESGSILAVAESMDGILNDPVLVRQIFPSRRRRRRSDVVTYRVRVDIKRTKPPEWRRLELASDLHLDNLHEIIRVAFGWGDTHLYRFASGSGPDHDDAEYYLCPYEVAERKVGIPDAEVRLDEVLVEAGDKLFYAYESFAYDFDDDGDDSPGERWDHVVKLEARSPRDESTPQAVCTAGRQPGPDIGIDEINAALSDLL